MKKLNKVQWLLFGGITISVLVVAGAGFRWVSLHRQGTEKFAELQPQLEKSKSEMLDLFHDRVVALEEWEKETTSKVSKPVAAELALSEMIKQAKDLKFENEQEAQRFDFVQNAVSEKINQYIQNDPSSKNLREMQRIEESINRKRKEYHRVAFEILDVETQYRLKEKAPVIFAAEKLLKEKSLF